jgi:hypothetical protein
MWKEFVSSCIKWWTNRNDDSQNRQWIQPLSDCDRWRFRLGTTRGCGCDFANRGRCTALVGRTTGQYVGLVLQFSTRSGWKIITNSGRYRGSKIRKDSLRARLALFFSFVPAYTSLESTFFIPSHPDMVSKQMFPIVHMRDSLVVRTESYIKWRW